MKKIIFINKNKKKEFWLDLNDILMVFEEPYFLVAEIVVRLKSGYTVNIRQAHDGTFTKKDFDKILNSTHKITKVAVTDLEMYEKSTSFVVTDWVSQVMG